MKRNYDNVAPFYDRLARLIYGRTLIDAQVFLLKAIPPNAKILVVGGGTGWILEEIAHIHPSGLTITYVDISVKMIDLAKKRNAGENSITFINAPIQEAVINNTFNVVITPFLLDNFTEDTIPKIFSQMHNLLTPKGLWLYCDFQNTNFLWQRAILKMMYLFFRSLCGIESNRLPNIDAHFTQEGYKTLAENTFAKGFIISRAYAKG